MAKKNNEDFSEFLDLEKEVLDNNDYSDFLNLEKEVESKKKSQSQSGSSTEESSSGTSATKKEQSSGTTKPLSLEEKKALARGQKLGQLEEKKQESKLALERKQKSTNINWDVDKETEQAFKGVATKEEKMEQAKQEAMSVGKTYVPNIEEKARAKEIQQAKPEQDLQRRLNLIPKEDLKSIFEGDNELTMFDGGQRLAEKYKLTEEEVDKAKAKYLDETVKEFKRKDLESSLDLINKYAPAPKDFKDITAYTQNMELLNKAKEMNFEKNKNLSFSLMGLEDNDRKVVDEYSSVMDRLNAYKEKSFMQQQQGADETGKGSMVINPKEIAQFEKDLKESQRLSKEIDKIRGNNNKLFDQYANIINKETGKEVTQESFTSKYENDYMKLKGALTDATYKLNYLTKEARRIRDTAQKAARGQTAKENEALSNLDRERNLAKAEVLALSNALFLNEDITRKVARYEKADSYYQMPGKKAERLFEVLSDLKQGFSETVLGEFNMTSTSEKNQARILNEKLKEVGINLKDIDKEIAPTFPEKMGNVLGTSAVLGANIAVTSFLTGGAGTLARGAGLLPKVFAMYDKGGKFSKIANMVISGVNFELASDDTSFAMGAAEEGAQIVFEKVFSKLKPLSPLVNFLTKSLTGAIGVTGEEYFGDLAEQFTKTGISQETLDATFGKSKEEGLEKFALTFTMGMMSMGKHAKILMVGSYKKAKEVNPNSETVKAMESVMSEMGVDPDDVVAQLKAEAQTKSDRLYPDGKGGQLSASNMTVEQEIVLREKLGYKPLTEEELSIKRIVQEQEELAPADSPYVTKKEMDDDLKVLKGEDEGTLPETYVGESVRTEEGIVTTVTEKVEEGTQLRVPTEQLVVDEAKPVAETFDRKKAGVIDVWQDPETNELFVINGTKRVATAMEDGVASVDVNFVKANSLQEAYKIGDLKNKLEDTDKTIDAVELVKANPTLKENLDLSKPKEAELYGLSSLNESLTEELKSNPNQAGVLSIIGNNVSTEKQSEVYQFAKDNNLGKDEVAQLVKEPELLDKATKKEVVKTNKALSSVEETTKALDFENTSDEELQTIYDNLSSSNNKEAKRLSNLIENVQEKNERNSILNTALSNVKNVVSKIIKSGEYFLEKREAREAIEVAEKYSGTVEKQEAKKDFKDAFFGNPNNWVADALKMREATRAFMEQGGTFKELLQSVQKEFEFDGYSEQEAASFIKSKLESITKKDFRQKSIAEEYHKAKKDGSNPELVEAIESVFSAQQNADVELKAEVEIKTKGVTEEKVSVQPKNIKDLYNVNRKLFGLDRLKSLSSAVVMDRMIGVMAKRAKITKEQMYGRLKFEKASEELVKNLSPKGKLLYQIVGENAQLGQNVRDNLQVARDMEASGNDAKTIRIATGWEKGKDGKWRYEILDTKMKFEPTTFSGNLSDVIDNKELFSLYPQLKNIQVNLRLNGIGEGEYRNNSITVNGGLRNMDSILLHEIQHAIQHIEGFAKGTNPGLQTLVSSAIPFSEIIKFEKSNKEYSDLVEKDEKGILSDEERDKMESMFEKFRKEYFEQNKPETGFERYRKTAGEVEARNVQTRMGMTSAQRRETTLEETEDVARDEQTVLFQKTQNKAQGAAMVANDGKAIIYALTDPNVTTPLHELAHVYEHYLTDAERKTIQEFAGTTEWTTETSEVFARGFEKYLADGVAPNSILQKVFEKFKEWLIDIYNGIKGSDIDIELNKPMRDIYAQMVGADNSLIKAEVEIKTELSKTGQSNIDALSKDATQLGLKPETLYDRVLANSPTVKALTEKYAKGVASGLYSTTEATNRLNSEIKENLDAIKKEAGLDEAKKEVAQLESALTSDKKTSSDVLRDIASKIDKMANGINTNPNSSLKVSILFGTEPYIAKAFLKTLSATLKTSATFMDGFNKAIAKFKNSDILKGKTAQEINDIVAQLTKATTDIKQIADLKNPITKLQQSKVKQAVEARIKYLYQNSMNTLPTQNSIEKIAEKSGIIDYKTFAENVYRRLNKLEQSRAKRMEKFEGAVSDFITKGGGSIKSLFNQLSDLILKDKQQATILRNIFLNAMSGVTTKGVKFTTSQISSITNAFQKANLNNLSGIYDLTQQIEQIVTKAVDFKVNEDINSLQKAIKKFKNIPKKQLMVFQTLANIEANHLTATTKTELLNALEDIKSYLSGSSNLSYNENQLNSIIKKAETESENYTNDKRKALIQKRYEEYKKNNPKTTLSEKEYENMIMLTEEQRAKERGVEKRGIKRDEKRADLEKLTKENIDELFNYKIGSSTSSAGKTVLEIDTFNKILIPALRKLIDTGELKNLSDIQLKEINQLHSELMNFDSLAKLGFVANQMSGVLKANENKQLIKDSFREFSNVIKSKLTPNKGKYQGLTLGQAFKRIFVGSTGQKISAEIISKVNVGINLAKTEYKKFNKNFEEALKFEVSSSENYDLGAKAYFLTSPKGLSEIDAQLLFENKKEKLQRDIDELRRISQSKDSSRNKKKSAEIRAKQYQESLDFINKFDTYEDYVNAYNNGEVFSEKQQRVFDLAKNEYEKQKPMLIASNILFNGNAFIEEDYYTSTSYLKNEVGAKADKSVAEEAFNNLNVIRDPQSGTVFKKVNPASVGTDKILDFDFTGVTQSRVLENYYDMFTRGSVIELDALLQAESFYENFKDKNMTETYSYLYQRIANWINNETSVQQSKLDNSRSLSKKTTDVLSNIKKAILNTTGQVVKQPTVLFHTLSRFGAKDFTQGLAFYANNLASEKGRDKIRQLLDGSDVRNRAPLGDEQIAQSLNRQKSFALTDSGTYRFLQKLYSEPLRMIPGFKDSKVASAISLQKALNIGDAAMVYSDIMAAQLTYITAMINQQKKEGYDVKSIDDLIFNKNEKNTHIADMLSAEINNESATSKQGNLFSGKDNKILANLFFMFQSHASNASHAASNALLDMFETNKNVTVEDRFNGVKAIVGFTSAIITFRAMSEIVKLLYAQIYETAAEEIGYEDPRDEEEKDRLKLLKDKQFLEEASYRIGINAFTDIFFGGKFPSPVKDLTVLGTNTLFENLHLKYVDEEYEGRLPYSSNPMEYSGVIGAGTDFISDVYKVMSPPLDNVERDDILREMALETLIRQQYESYKNDKQGAFIDGLYTMFKLSGKGEPAKMMQMLQKQRERGFKEEDEKRTGVLDLLFEKRK